MEESLANFIQNFNVSLEYSTGPKPLVLTKFHHLNDQNLLLHMNITLTYLHKVCLNSTKTCLLQMLPKNDCRKFGNSFLSYVVLKELSKL